LLVNAIKYSPAGSTITVRGRQESHHLLLQVKDEGIGIAPVDQPKIFERFYRIDNEITRDVSGAGLGLAISRGIIEAHGGRIWVESAPGQGSTFSVTLPVGPTQ
jgi:signal transduction histidine kinase